MRFKLLILWMSVALTSISAMEEEKLQPPRLLSLETKHAEDEHKDTLWQHTLSNLPYPGIENKLDIHQLLPYLETKIDLTGVIAESKKDTRPLRKLDFK